jgi:hypothetical protein
MEQTIPSGVIRKLDHACSLVGQAGGSTGRVRKRLFSAAKTAKRGAQLARKAGRQGRLGAECAEALRGRFQELRDRAGLIGGSL